MDSVTAPKREDMNRRGSRVATAMYEWVDHPQPFRIDADDRRS